VSDCEHGAGSNTRFWRINVDRPSKGWLQNLHPAQSDGEHDQEGDVDSESREHSEQLENVILENGGTTLHSVKYHMLPADPRSHSSEPIAPLFTSTSPSSSSQECPILSSDLPTLLLFECVLVYVAPEASQVLVQWFVDYLAPSSVLGVMVYKMFGLNASFRTMIAENLKVRGVSLPGAEPHPAFESLPQHFTKHEFTASKALTLLEIRETFIPYEESRWCMLPGLQC